MQIVLYSLSLRVTEFLVRLAGIFNPKAREFIKGRQGVWLALAKQLDNNTAPIVWVHCSSVGEYEQGRPLMEALKAHYSGYKVLVTFYSPSGYQAIVPNNIVDYKTYLPFDSQANAHKFISMVNPRLAFFIKYEFWHFYLTELKHQQIPVYSISAIFRPQQAFFKWYGGFFRNMLRNFSFFFVQDKASHDLLHQLSINSNITGDTRLDRVLKIREHKQPITEIEQFVNGKAVMVVGSMRKEDIPVVIPFIQHHPELKFIVAPHEITESMMQPLEKEIPSTIRFSKTTRGVINQQVIIIDNIGMLSKLYQYADFAYIGGGFSDGLHNILEPAVFEIPVFFGNKDYQRFKEAIDLIDLGAALPIGSFNEFEIVFNDLQSTQDRLPAIRKTLANYIDDNRGAADKIMTYLKQHIS